MNKYEEALEYFKNDSVLAMVCVVNGLKERDYKEALYFINEAIEKANKYDELEKLREEIGDILFTTEDISFQQIVNSCQGLVLKYLRQRADRRENNDK